MKSLYTLNGKSVLIPFIFLLLVTGLLAQNQAGSSQMVEAVGTATIMYGDVAAARDRALDDALRKAVEQALGTFLDAQTTVENYMVVEDRIINWSRGYVKRFEILSDVKTSPETYQMRVRAEVDMGNLQQDAEAVNNLINSMGNPRVMILIDEHNIGDSGGLNQWFDVNVGIAEAAMMEKFMEKNFDVVDPATVRQNKKHDQILAALRGDEKAAAAIAASYDAEVIITGKAVATVANTTLNLGGMKSCQANITARVVNSDVGSVLATGSEHAPQVHIDEITGGTMAIQKASKKLADQLIGKILEKWRSKFYDVTSLKLVVTGISSYKDISDFKNTLQFALRGVKNIFQREVSGGAAEFDLKITGSGDQLARDLDDRQLDRYKTQVVGVSPNKVTIQVVKTESQPAAPQNNN